MVPADAQIVTGPLGGGGSFSGAREVTAPGPTKVSLCLDEGVLKSVRRRPGSTGVCQAAGTDTDSGGLASR